MNEFLNPKSMSTPGITGALMMLLANSICASFPELAFRYVSLSLSFLIGSIVFASANLKMWERGAYWIVNSLIIFSMGVGASNIAANVSSKADSHAALKGSAIVADVVASTVFRTAYAQEPNSMQTAPPVAKKAGPPKEIHLLESQIKNQQEEIRRSRQENERLRNRVNILDRELEPASDAQTQQETIKEELQRSRQEIERLHREIESASDAQTQQRTIEQEGFFKTW